MFDQCVRLRFALSGQSKAFAVGVRICIAPGIAYLAGINASVLSSYVDFRDENEDTDSSLVILRFGS